MDLTKMSRKEKFRYLKSKGFKVRATASNADLDALLDMEEPPADQPSIRGERAKRERVPLGRHRQRMGIGRYEVPTNKVPRWVNDKGTRVSDALAGGYEFVRDPSIKPGEDDLISRNPGDAVSMKVGTKKDGSPLTAYLMMIDKELYDEDQKEKQRRLDEIDSAIQHGRHESQFEDGKYVPKSGIRYNPRG